MDRNNNAPNIYFPLRTACARALNILANMFLCIVILACVVDIGIDVYAKFQQNDLSGLILLGTRLVPCFFAVLACYLVKGFAVIVEWYGLCISANQHTNTAK